jgi:epoxyqueuosine reductase
MSIVRQIKDRARELDCDVVGVAPAAEPHGVRHLHDWLERGFAGEMRYMQRNAQAREHPRSILDGVRSVIMVAMNYRTVDPTTPGPLEGRVSRYAWGTDYHRIVRDRLEELGDCVHELIPGCRTRAVVDTAPLLERDFARLAGIGWIGKNTMLINKRLGSWLFLGALLTDAELEYDTPHAANHCGTCTRCLDACPTDAFVGPYQLDSRRCISYLTIELRGPIPPELRDGIGDWLYGCDICQEVCPWNRKAPLGAEPGFRPASSGGNLNLVELLQQSESELRSTMAASTMTRAGVSGLRRNAAIVLGNAAGGEAVDVLRRCTQSGDATVRDAAEWALRRITDRAANSTNAETQNMPPA